MPSIDHSAVTDAEADRVWSVLKRLSAIAGWHPAFAESCIDGDVP